MRRETGHWLVIATDFWFLLACMHRWKHFQRSRCHKFFDIIFICAVCYDVTTTIYFTLFNYGLVLLQMSYTTDSILCVCVCAFSLSMRTSYFAQETDVGNLAWCVCIYWPCVSGSNLGNRIALCTTVGYGVYHKNFHVLSANLQSSWPRFATWCHISEFVDRESLKW